MPKDPDPEEYDKKVSLLQTLIVLFLIGYIDLRFGDETAFTLVPNVPYGWIPKGEQRSISSQKGGNLNVFGLLNLDGKLTTYQTTASINSQAIIDMLDNFAQSIDKITIIVLDNASWHISKAIKEKIEEWEKIGLFIFYLPPYSPHLNIIEILWRKIKLEWLRPNDFLSKEHLHKAINLILENYNSGLHKIDFMTAKK